MKSKRSYLLSTEELLRPLDFKKSNILEMTLYDEDTGYSKWNLQAAFYMAIKNNRTDIVENLLKNYAVDVDTKFGASEQPAVSLAVECGHADVLKCLLEQGCSVNQTDSHGETPLHR